MPGTTDFGALLSVLKLSSKSVAPLCTSTLTLPQICAALALAPAAPASRQCAAQGACLAECRGCRCHGRCGGRACACPHLCLVTIDGQRRTRLLCLSTSTSARFCRSYPPSRRCRPRTRYACCAVVSMWSQPRQVRECGMAFKWSLFGMTRIDAKYFAQAVKQFGRLKTLELQNRLDCWALLCSALLCSALLSCSRPTQLPGRRAYTHHRVASAWKQDARVSGSRSQQDRRLVCQSCAIDAFNAPVP